MRELHPLTVFGAIMVTLGTIGDKGAEIKTFFRGDVAQLLQMEGDSEQGARIRPVRTVTGSPSDSSASMDWMDTLESETH